jgi:protein SCO1/2
MREAMRRSATYAVVAAVLVLGGADAGADRPGSDASAGFADFVEPLPATYRAGGVKIDEHLGAKVPLDVPFRTSDGELTTLGNVLRGELPTILTFNYSDCPMLCSMQLNGLSAAVPGLARGEVPLLLGKQYRIVTIDLEPNESLEKLAAMKARYIERLVQLAPSSSANKAELAAGWTFLAAAPPGIDASIRRVADAVGFRYAYVPERAEWAHPAALMFVSSAGTITRYVYGLEFDAAMMRESIFKAGVAEPATTVGFMFRCYHFDPDANSYAHAGVVALRLAAGGAVALLLAGLGVLRLIRRAKPALTSSSPRLERPRGE